MTAGPDVSSQPVLLDKLDAGVLTLTLNRPERLNAMNIALIQALLAAAQRAAADSACRAVLITGAGRGFLRRGGSHRPGARSGRRST